MIARDGTTLSGRIWHDPRREASAHVSLFSGSAVVVTGASSGIGRALAVELAGQGARLALAARDEARLQETASAVRAAGGEALVVPADVTKVDDCRRLVERAVQSFGGLDVLVNNAGITAIGAFEELQDLAVVEQVMRVNYLGSVYPTHFALPHLRKSRGLVAMIASLTALTGVPTRAAYAASKHAVLGFSDSLRVELRGSGVGVTVVCPDFVVSEIQKRGLGPDGRPIGRSPLDESKIMSAEECARLTVRAMETRQRLSVLSLRGRVGRLLRVFAPGVVDAIADRAVRKSH
jgi:short-subunit dehydrogenase